MPVQTRAARERARATASTSSVLHVAELLELILAELPPVDIFRCQRVNKSWYNLITQSTLLQYKSWLRDDHPDSAHRVRVDDLVLELDEETKGELDYEEVEKYESEAFEYNTSRHLHPVIAARVNGGYNTELEDSILIDPNQDPRHGFQASLPMNPMIIREILNWYEQHKGSERKWGHISLFRPEVYMVCWGLSFSDKGGMSIEVRAKENSDHQEMTGRSTGSVLTVGEFVRRLSKIWEAWIEEEHEVHYLSHDGPACDLDRGIPPEECLRQEFEHIVIDEGAEEDEHDKTIDRMLEMEMDRRIWNAMEKASEPHWGL